MLSIPSFRGRNKASCSSSLKIFSSKGKIFKLEEQLALLRPLKEGMESICLNLGYDARDITFPFLYRQLEEVTPVAYNESCVVKEDLQSHVMKALQVCLEMREKEGEALLEAMQVSLEKIRESLLVIEKKSIGMEDHYRKKILNRLQEFKEALEDDRDRVLREVFFYAEKSDIAEEITRLNSHIVQLSNLFLTQAEGGGKAIDFLLQEMSREINTMSAKSDDLELSYAVLKCKGEIEKMREQ